MREKARSSSSMAAAWVKSLHCKSRAFHDVIHPKPKHHRLSTTTTTSWRNSFHDVIHSPIPKPNPDSHHPLSRRSESVKAKPDPVANINRVRRTLSAPISGDPDHLPFFPAVSDLPEGHPSRNVVEIIFHTRWGPKPFPGRVETVLKIQTPAHDSARFEDYREFVRRRVGSGRCSADGNEMMRFRCLGTASYGGGCGGGGLAGAGKKGAEAVCTYAGSGRAHECAGGGWGRRAMLVCRVIAGRVGKRAGPGEGSVSDEFDSVEGEDGELVVLDSRAVLPCFLVIYRL